jgi:hypothetical protein
MNHNKKFVAFFVSLAILLVVGSQISVYAEIPAKVAILPVKIHAPEKMEYLQAGLMDMLASRIGGKHNVQILDRKQVAKTFKKFKKDLNQTTAISLAEDLGADYIVLGSVTFFGTGGSIDFKVFSGDAAKPPLAFYSLIEDMNNLLPQFSQVVDEINATAFAPRSSQVAAGSRPQAQQPQATQAAPLPAPKPAASAPQAQQVQAAPASVPTGTTPAGPKMASISQQRLQETPVSSKISRQAPAATPLALQASPWKSQELSQTLFSMDIGDLFGDGSKELVGMSRKKIFVYRYEAKGLQELARYRATKDHRFVWVSVADINRNGRDEIFVSSQKKMSNIRMKASSFVLEWDGEKFARLAENLDYYLRAVRVPGQPVRLLAQKSAPDGTPLAEIYNFVWKNKTLAPGTILSFPESADIYNSTMGDITGRGESETVMISPKRYLVLIDTLGQPLWRSTESYATTENSIKVEIPSKDIPQPIDDLKGDAYRFAPIRDTDEGVKYLYLPSPVLLTDLDRDNRLEVVVSHNLPGFAQLTGSRQYSKGEILSLTWGGTGMLENWKTGEIKGEISSLQVGDLNGDGHQELIVCTTESGGIAGLWSGKKSVIMSYALTPR